jgi:hypothetical protein
MSNWCLGCQREIQDGDYCSICQFQLGVDSLGFKPDGTPLIPDEEPTPPDEDGEIVPF